MCSTCRRRVGCKMSDSRVLVLALPVAAQVPAWRVLLAWRQTGRRRVTLGGREPPRQLPPPLLPQPPAASVSDKGWVQGGQRQVSVARGSRVVVQRCLCVKDQPEKGWGWGAASSPTLSSSSPSSSPTSRTASAFSFRCPHEAASSNPNQTNPMYTPH